MENNNTGTQKSLKQTFLQWYGKASALLLNKLLYVTIAVSLFLSIRSVREVREVGQIVFLTLSETMIGNKPGRLFGLLSLIPMSIKTIRAVIFVICLINTFFSAHGISLFLKHIKNDRTKMITLCSVMALYMVIFDYYSYILWDYTSVSLYISLTFVIYGAYFLIMTDKRAIAPLFFAAAQFIDCRAAIFITMIALIVIFVKPVHREIKSLKVFNMISLAVSALILAVSFISVDFSVNTDSEAVDKIFTERYIEAGLEEEDINPSLYAFKFNSYITLTPQELFSDTLTGIANVKDVIFEDHIQLIILIFFASVILYDHKDDCTAEKVSAIPVT